MSEVPSIRAGDTDRDRVVSLLGDHLVAGRLTLDEFTERVDLTHAARTLHELEEVTRDLPATQAAPAAATSRRRAPRWAIGVMGSVEKRSRWRVPESLNAVAVMGSVELDLRKAEIASREVEIHAVAVMGSVEIVVPEGVDVELTGFALMGSKEEKVAESAPVPGAPFVRVRALVLMGSVEVKSKPGPRRRALPPLPPPPR